MYIVIHISFWIIKRYFYLTKWQFLPENTTLKEFHIIILTSNTINFLHIENTKSLSVYIVWENMNMERFFWNNGVPPCHKLDIRYTFIKYAWTHYLPVIEQWCKLLWLTYFQFWSLVFLCQQDLYFDFMDNIAIYMHTEGEVRHFNLIVRHMCCVSIWIY